VPGRTRRGPANTYQDFEFGVRVRSQIQYRIGPFDSGAITTYPAAPHPTITIAITTPTIQNELTQLSHHHKAVARTDYSVIGASSRRRQRGSSKPGDSKTPGI